MAIDYQSLLDMLNPKKEEELFTPMTPTAEQLTSPVNPTQEQLVELTQPEPMAEMPAQPVVKAAPAAPRQDQLKAPAKDDLPKPPMQDTPLSKSEALIAEYNKMLGRDQEALAEARKSDRMLKVGGALGDALATYLNAKSQMNVKAPGVQVQQGAGLDKVAEMFATAPGIQSDIAARRENLMKQYGELAKGERAQARLTAEKEMSKERMTQQERLADKENQAMLQAAGIRGSKSGESLDFRKKEAEYNKVVKLQDSFNKDKQVVKAEERMASAKTMRDFLADNNPIGAEAAKRFAARASGEVGTLTDQDVSVFGGSRALLDRLEQTAQQLASGTLTDNNRKFMSQLADTFEKAGQRDLQDRLNIYAKQGTKRSKMSEDEVREIIRPDLVLQKQEQSTTTKPQTILRKDKKSGRTVEYDAQTKKPIRFVD